LDFLSNSNAFNDTASLGLFGTQNPAMMKKRSEGKGERRNEKYYKSINYFLNFTWLKDYESDISQALIYHCNFLWMFF